MKKQKFLFGALTALAMGAAFTACSDDPVNDGIDNGKVEKDQTRYLNISICNPSAGSRAEASTTDADFVTGSKDENYVHQPYFVFYDADGVALDYEQITFVNNTNTNNTGTNSSNGTFNPEGDNQSAGSVGKVWTSVVPVELAAGQNMPAYVMAFVNPITPADILNASMSDIEALMRTQVVGDDEHFPMSNSVYYGTNPITGQANVRMTATPITTAQLFNSREDAEKATETSVDIYVERYASRIDLSLAGNTVTANTTDVNGYSLQFVPEYWRPNAIDLNTYVLKHYAINTNGVINSTPTYTQLNERLEWGWNDGTNFRSYWACSPSYYNATYPKVSDNIQDGGKYNLHYFSYNEIKDSKIGEDAVRASIEYNNGFTGPFYARESTASSASWQNATEYNPAAVVTSAVIVGRYKLTATGATDPVADNTTFYLYGKTNDKWNLYFVDGEGVTNGILAAMVQNQNVVLDAAHNPVRTTDIFEVKHPTKAVRDVKNSVVAGRLVALQPKSTATGYYYYDPTVAGTDKYVAITADNLNNVNSDLLSAGYARQYGEGLAYFSIPIQHLGFNQTGTLDYTTARAGSFGLVRNHVYAINVKSISGLATALRDANQPIVPPMDEQTYYINARLNVLNWRLVPTQEVEL